MQKSGSDLYVGSNYRTDAILEFSRRNLDRSVCCLGLTENSAKIAHDRNKSEALLVEIRRILSPLKVLALVRVLPPSIARTVRINSPFLPR